MCKGTVAELTARTSWATALALILAGMPSAWQAAAQTNTITGVVQSTCATRVDGRATVAGTTGEGKDAFAPAKHQCSDEARERAYDLIVHYCGGHGGWGLFWCDDQGKLHKGEIEYNTRPPDGMASPR